MTSPSVALLTVHVSGWEVECCLEPPEVGATVDWTLSFTDGTDAVDAEQLVTLAATATPLDDWEGATLGRSPVRLDVGHAALHWEASAPVSGACTLVGSVYLAHHGEAPEDFPETRGVVRRLRLAGTLYEERPPGSRSWTYVLPRDVTHRDVERSPEWFTDDLRVGTRARLENALLVDLEVLPRT